MSAGDATEEDGSSFDFRPDRATHWWTRVVVLRGLGLVYAVAFGTLITQGEGLLGARGVLPAQRYLARFADASGGVWASFLERPTLFWANASDTALLTVGWVGCIASLAVLAGVTNAAVMAALWVLHLSVVHVGQVWYGYGWELLLLEAGFLAIFLCPWRTLRPLPPDHPPPPSVIWLYRWLALRLMLGAGLIKIRGDVCWRELTCLFRHYETQPNPSPMSWVMHHAPHWLHRTGVAFNHLVELVAPFGAVAPRPYRPIAGLLFVVFQLLLIVSGNLSYLNWLTLAVCLACFDDRDLERLVPARFRAARPVGEERLPWDPDRLWRQVRPRHVARAALVAVVAFSSIDVVANLASPRQAMNRSYDRLHLVNTYGAFGSVGAVRREIVIEGTADELGPDARWEPYELPCKPGDPDRRPCLVTPYHLRLDWQMWFAPLWGGPDDHPWIHPVVDGLLQGNPAVEGLFTQVPFEEAPPRYVRIMLYRYRFTEPGEAGWWVREPLGTWMPAVSRDDPWLRDRVSWVRGPGPTM